MVPVLYFHEIDCDGDDDWKVFVVYEEENSQYVLYGTRRRIKTIETGKNSKYSYYRMTFNNVRTVVNYLTHILGQSSSISSPSTVNITLFNGSDFSSCTEMCAEEVFTEYFNEVDETANTLVGYDDNRPGHEELTDFMYILSEMKIEE